MCGIIAIVDHQRDVVPRLLSGLKSLEYRGYDSAGIAVTEKYGEHIKRNVAIGKVDELIRTQVSNPISGTCGIGHTRWATHGAPDIANAHPIVACGFAVVHNGIIDNYREIREKLDYQWSSATDTEVIPVLVDHYRRLGLELLEAVTQTVRELHGVFAFVLITAEGTMLAVQKGLPLAIGYNGDGTGVSVSSDVAAFSDGVTEVSYLKNGDIAVVKANGADLWHIQDDGSLEAVSRSKNVLTHEAKVGRGHYDTFMLKEIEEQPDLLRTLYYRFRNNRLLDVDWSEYDHIHFIACGSSFYAASIARIWAERVVKKRATAELSSEFRLRIPYLDNRTLYVFISQSGETLDTVLALQHVKEQGLKTVTIVNSADSYMGRLADLVVPLDIGREIGVAATKTFTSQLLVLLLMLLEAASNKELITSGDLASLQKIPSPDLFVPISNDIAGARSLLYVGRGTSAILAMEGALKMKELAYIPSEGMSAGELKHGSLALVDENLPVIVIAPKDDISTKLAGNIQEIAARKGRIIMITTEGEYSDLQTSYRIEMPAVHDFFAPILYSIPLQFLAYYTAVKLQRDIDKPRNLAKSVTVE